jgi:hypothetical protein
VWVYGETPGGSGDLSLFVGGGPLRLRCAAGADLLLDPSQRFEVIKDGRFRGEYKVRTLAYVYKLEVADAGELISWHWHPLTTPDRPNPHVHITADNPGLGRGLGELHVPTGRVSFEEVARFLIRDLDVQPARDDHLEILAEAEERFRTFRTWA